MSLDFDTLRKRNVKRCNTAYGPHTLLSWNPLEWAGAMCGEAGEAANIAKKMRRQLGDDPATEELTIALGEELADVVIYADLIAARIGIDLGEAVRRKFNIVSERVASEIRL